MACFDGLFLMFIGALVENHVYELPIILETKINGGVLNGCRVEIVNERLCIQTPSVQFNLPCSIKLKYLDQEKILTFIVVPNLYEASC